MLLVVVVVLALVGGAAAYFVSRDDGGSGVATDLTLDDLRPALVTEDDVGEPYVETLDEDDQDGVVGPSEMDLSDECRDTVGRLGDTGDRGDDLVIELTEPELDAGVQHSLELVEPGDPSLAEIEDSLRSCSPMSYTDAETGTEVTMDLVPEPIDPIGDETLAFAAEIDLTSPEAAGFAVRLHAYWVVVERDGVLSLVSVIGGFDSTDHSNFEGEPADRDLALRLAQTADDRVQDIVGG